MIIWIGLKWYQLWCLQPTAYSAYFNDRVLPLPFSRTGLPQDESAKERLGKWLADIRQSQDRLWSMTYALKKYVNDTIQEMVQSAKTDDAGTHVRRIFQENVDELRISANEFTASRKDFEEDADFLQGEYKPIAKANWSQMQPEVRRVRLW
ncbi:hypothetical protein BT69DRAFT_1319076 [Atractiella rhizophila]|nr:hypothetical protein BT69DRAFT_1319076 [Atractiella rhizophila]